MKHPEFNRGIKNKEFIAELNRNKYFQEMKYDKDLFIAIRKEYINVYFFGQSICKIEYLKRSKELKWTSHPKYVGENGSKYVNTGSLLENIPKLKENAKKYSGKEKLASYKEILNLTKSILDVEVTLTRNKVSIPKKISDYERSSIDYVSVEEKTLVFYEAKHITNPEIRSNKIPKVFDQVSRYEKGLMLHNSEIINSYNLVIKNLKELKINSKFTTVNSIDYKPRLIVFGYDKHLKKLADNFGSRLIIK